MTKLPCSEYYTMTQVTVGCGYFEWLNLREQAWNKRSYDATCVFSVVFDLPLPDCDEKVYTGMRSREFRS